jgi:Tol biopolymer transport system component
LWTKNLATEAVSQIMPAVEENHRSGSVAHYIAPRFSPDGRWIYYIVPEEQMPCSIVRIPVSGGKPRSIVPCGESNFAISPDGKQLAFVRGFDLIVADADGKGERTLGKRGNGKNWFNSWSAEMSWSPDGTKITIGGGRREPNERYRAELIEISVADGSEKLIPIPDWNFVDQVAWLADSSGLLVIAKETNTSEGQIFHIAYPSGETRRITNDTTNYVRLSLSADSNLLVAHQIVGQLNIWAGKLSNANNLEQITFSQFARDGYSGLAFLPDGKILYSSPRNGNVDLWTMKPDGSEQNQLTRNAGNFNGYPQITTDGRFIVFTSTRTGEDHIWRMDISGRNSIQLTHGFHEAFPNISADGKWVYFDESEGKGYTIKKVSIYGGEPVRVSGNLNAGRPYISPDGRFIVYTDSNGWKTGLMTAEGKKIKFFDFNPIRHLIYWTPDSKSLIYLCRNSSAICQSFINGNSKPQIIADYKNAWLVNFAISTDTDKLIVSRGNYTNEAVLITDFK